MRRIGLSTDRIFGLLLLVSAFATNIAAQSLAERQIVGRSQDFGWWFFNIALLVVACLGGAYYLWRKSNRRNKGKYQPRRKHDDGYINYDNDSSEMERVDAEMEKMWRRKGKKPPARPVAILYRPKDAPRPKAATVPTPAKISDVSLGLDTKIFQEKMKKLQYSQLPINSFNELTPASVYEPLQLSTDECLINAIDQAREEFEEDETVRDLAIRILAAFRTRNSVNTLWQIALYDLSANLRSKAVSILTDFDHESVFEAILLACADPTREVRAAAARGLFRLHFDRADAWKRIIERNDDRMSHAARAAIEAGIVVKSFDRLIHEDSKVAYEAFTLATLLIRSGETRELFEAIRTHKDERVRFALLHVLKVHKDERTLPTLKKLHHESACTTDVADRIREAINSFEQVAVSA